MFKKKTTISFTICILLILGFSTYLFSQTDSNKTFSESYDIFKTYKPKVSDAIKLTVNPVNEKPEVQKVVINYTSILSQYDTTIDMNAKLPAVSYVKTNTGSLDHLFIKAGVGNFSNILAEAYYNSTKTNDGLLTAYFKHYSGDCNSSNSNFGSQAIEVNGKKFYNHLTLDGKLYFYNDIVHYYGQTDTNNNIKQDFSTFGLKAGVDNSLDLNTKLNYKIGGEFYKLSDSYSSNLSNSNETSFNLLGTVEQKLSKDRIRFDLDYKYFNYNSYSDIDRNNFNIRANYVIKKNLILAEIGFKVNYESDSTQSATHLYPDVYIEGSIIDKYLSGFAGVTGENIVNSYLSYMRENPFIEKGILVKNTNDEFEIFGGIKGNISNQVDFILRLSYENIDNLPLFVNDTVTMFHKSKMLNKFKVIYDSSTVTLLKIHGEVGTSLSENFSLFLMANYYKYDNLGSEAYPWHLPGFDMKLTMRYSLQNKIILNFDFFYIGQRKAKNLDSISAPPINLDPIFDMNIGLTYKFSSAFGIFFQFDNILYGKEGYEYWNSYPVQGFHLLFGIKANL